mgnify:CR=1 FL=1
MSYRREQLLGLECKQEKQSVEQARVVQQQILSNISNQNLTLTKKIVDNIHLTEKTLGDGIKQCQKSELENKIQCRWSITIIKNCKKGEIINLSKIDLKRPATGIEPKFLNKVIGKKSKRELKIDEALVWKDLY